MPPTLINKLTLSVSSFATVSFLCNQSIVACTWGCALALGTLSASKTGSAHFKNEGFKFNIAIPYLFGSFRQRDLNNEVRPFTGRAVYNNISVMPLHHNIIA